CEAVVCALAVRVSLLELEQAAPSARAARIERVRGCSMGSLRRSCVGVNSELATPPSMGNPENRDRPMACPLASRWSTDLGCPPALEGPGCASDAGRVA